MVSDLHAQAIRPRTVIDVGANVGQFALAACHFFNLSSIHCFEPAPDSVTRLRCNLARFGGAIIHPIALSDRPGEATFYLNAHRHSSSLLPLAESHKEAFPGATVIKTLTVPVSTLDAELDTQSLGPPVLLKVDAQGAEAAVIKGGAKTLEQTDYVVVETSLTPMYQGESLFSDIQALMRDYGFDFKRPVGWLTHPRTREVIQMDALFTKE
jgi:FkbM family methyltransferase